MGIRELFRGERESRNRKPTGGDKSRVSMPSGEGFVSVRLIQPPDEKSNKSYPFSVAYQYFLPGQVLTSPNTKDPATGYLQGPDPIAAQSRKYWQRYSAAKKSGQDTDALYKQAKSLTPTARYTWLAVETEKPDEGVKLLTVSESLHKHLVDLIAGNPDLGDDGAGDVFDFDHGRTLRLVKSKGNGGFFVFDKSRFLEPSSFGTHIQRAGWLAQCPDLNGLNQPDSIETLNIALHDLVGEAKESHVGPPSVGMTEEEFFASIQTSM